MTAIENASFSQSTAVSISKTTELNYERSAHARAASLNVRSVPTLPRDPVQGLLDVINISEEAREVLLRQRQDADRLAAAVRRGAAAAGVLGASLPPAQSNNLIQIDVSAVQQTESFSFSETYELSVLQESTLSVETEDGGSVEITQSRLIEVSLSASFEYNASNSVASVGISRAA